ncbi:PQQ-dependent sugar dehydrogenase [Luteolibacter sp. SL250]|uniref:PQQ-dependent sugar dehydrogenase n=1 Tax=Luteolibacter sp. SL250 TaxID=2995170 RepID=UPI00227164E8|nr:PA14 domain-containing protein [Luteolibacter sp. SL250]WAC20738.1 PQQ-dependent sugar dehydrogenase [Luteolibacter sp. SL250]
MRRFFTSFLTIAALAACLPGHAETGPFLNGVFPKSAPGPSGNWALADAFPNLTFVDPVRLAADPRDPSKGFVICRNGQIWHIPLTPDAKPEDKVLALDLSANTLGFGDSGMMSMVFHPDFNIPDSPNRGHVYVYYQWVPEQPGDFDPATPNYLRLSRFTIADGAATIDPASEFVMIQQFDRHAWHTGGGMFFGQDRFLYLAIGDEGGSKDFYKSGQKINDRLFGGILRIDVDQDPARSHPVRRRPQAIPVPAGWPETFTQGYSIPNDNPWLDQKGGVLEEFWSIGTRNPHSMCLDEETGEIFVADVGQDSREEITIARKGGNHQWPYKEGSIDGPMKKPAKLIGKEVPPVFDYARTMGGCVIGGMVYRGSAHAGTLTGRYIFGDHASRSIHALDQSDAKHVEAEFLTGIPRSPGDKRLLSGISEGPDGEPYFIELGDPGTDTGKIHRLIRSGTPVPEPPRLLSQTGAFTDTAALVPSPALLPYAVNSPLWTDGAAKQRWISLPSGAEKVRYREQGEWDFPVGTVLVKHFALPVDDRDPTKVKPVETRFFVHGEGGHYYGVTYRWNEAGTDAELISKRENRRFQITGKDGKKRSQTWTFPSRSDCFTCHTPEAGSVLGLRSHQFSPEQLESWNRLGHFGESFGKRDPHTLVRAVDPHDPHASLDDRVKSYLDANCAHCHHPGGVAANFDATYTRPLSAQKLVRGMVNRPFTGAQDRVVAAGDLPHSVLAARMGVTGDKQMPPLGKNVVDRKAVALVEDWIRSLDDDRFPPNTQPGLQADYYKGSRFDELVLSRTDPAVDFDWGNGYPAEEVGVGNFSVRWHGEVIPPASGTYNFIATNDDGIRVIVNGVKVIDSWADQPATERSGPIQLTAGRPADLVVEFYKSTPGATVKLAWSGPGITRGIIPENAYRRSSTTDQEPVAEDDEIQVKRSGPTAIDVLDNDVGFNAPLGIHGVSITETPVHGTIRISGATGKLTYTPDATGPKEDSFRYTVSDSRGLISNEATVVLTPGP